MNRRVPKARVPQTIQLGFYQHYKGPMYEVTGLARNANKEGELSVIYHSVEPHGKEAPMTTYRKVDGKDGFFTPVWQDGEWRPRFVFLFPLNNTNIRRPIVKK